MSDFIAHADSTDLKKIEGLLQAGLYIAGTMLVMELDINKTTDIYCEEWDNRLEEYDSSDLGEYIKAHDRVFDIDDFESVIKEELGYEDATIYVIRDRKRIVSSITVWKHESDKISCENIFTIPSYRGRRMASALLTYAIRKAGECGNKKARLTVYGDNVEAIALYYGLGFNVTKVLQEFRSYGET